jgi:STAS-like domain of unknown function (DUF4325)
MIHISIKAEFSDRPGHRTPSDGDNSGQEFLTNVLRPKFERARDSNESILVDLDGTAGYATSFLEAAFGGLSREYGKDEVLKRLQFKSEEEPYLIDEIRGYIEEAQVKPLST